MTIEEALQQYLIADTGVSLLVGTKVKPQKLAQLDKPPYIAYARVGSFRPKTFQGPTDLIQVTIKLDCWAQDQVTAKAVAKAVRNATGPGLQRLDGFKGTMGTVVISAAFLEDDNDNFSAPVHDDETGMYQVSLSWEVWHTEQ